MPTDLHRYQVTETEAVKHALDLAAAKWPAEPRSRLVPKLVEEWARMQERLTAIDRTAGMFDFPVGYLEDLRRDWPE